MESVTGICCINFWGVIKELSHYNAQTIMSKKYFCVQLLLKSPFKKIG